MRATEFLPEAVSRAETTEHLINRLNKAAELCDAMGNVPLLIREFKTGINSETVLAKVINNTDTEGARGPRYVKGGVGKEGQTAILEKLGIENPVFTKMDLPSSTFAFHGDPHIFIPPPGSECYYSSKIEDLGGQRLAGEKREPGETITVGWMKDQADKWASTYVQGMPKDYTSHEIIWDCPDYYLLNIKSFLAKFAGKDNKYSLTADTLGHKKIDPAVWAERIRTYSDVAQYIRKYGIPYVEWYKNNIEGKSPGERQTSMANKPQKPTWEVKSEKGHTVWVSADNEREAIWSALNSRSASGRFGMFPNGKDSIVSVKPKDSVTEDNTLLGSKPKRNPKYLGPTAKVKNISPVLGNSKRKMQTPLNKKFFGGS